MSFELDSDDMESLKRRSLFMSLIFVLILNVHVRRNVASQKIRVPDGI